MALYDKQIAEIYDFWTTHGYYDYKKDAETVARIIGKRKKIIELGIGTGNIAIPLAKKGYEVSGIDVSSYMLAILKRKLKKKKVNIKFWKQDLRKLKPRDKYDVALSAGGAFIYAHYKKQLLLETYFSKRSEIPTVFRKVFNLLNPKGLFLINIQYHGKHFELKLPDGTKYWFDIKDMSPRYKTKTQYFEKNGKIYLKLGYKLYNWSKKEINELAKKIGFRVRGFDKGRSFYIFERP